MRRLLVAFVFVLLGYAHALAWSDTAHSIIAEIAQRHLTDTAKGVVDSLLKGESLAAVASWADDFDLTSAGLRTAPWHYVNIDSANQVYADSDCKDGNCIVAALGREITILTSGDVSVTGMAARRTALLFVVNLVGDIHQPLRCVQRTGDGGQLAVQFSGGGTPVSTTLRDFWDRAIVADRAGSWGSYVDELDTVVVPTLPAVALDADTATYVTKWANECHEMGQKAYAMLPTAASGSTIQLSEADRAAARPIMEKELALAGMRLAAVLNKLTK